MKRVYTNANEKRANFDAVVRRAALRSSLKRTFRILAGAHCAHNYWCVSISRVVGLTCATRKQSVKGKKNSIESPNPLTELLAGAGLFHLAREPNGHLAVRKRSTSQVESSFVIQQRQQVEHVTTCCSFFSYQRIQYKRTMAIWTVTRRRSCAPWQIWTPCSRTRLSADWSTYLRRRIVQELFNISRISRIGGRHTLFLSDCHRFAKILRHCLIQFDQVLTSVFEHALVSGYLWL